MQLNQYRIDVNIFFYFKIMKKNKDKKKQKKTRIVAELSLICLCARIILKHANP